MRNTSENIVIVQNSTILAVNKSGKCIWNCFSGLLSGISINYIDFEK